MNIRIITFVVACSVVAGKADDTEDCNKDVSREFVENYYKFCTKIFRTIGSKYLDHFVVSPYNVWLTLAAVGEGSTGSAQEELFSVLNLPKELCLRQKYYEIALSLEIPATDVIFARKRIVVFDKDVHLNSTWVRSVISEDLIKKIFLLPLKTNPELSVYYLTLLSLSRLSEKSVVGNSLLVDSLDYSGLWTTEFSFTNIQYKMPFYNDAGLEIGQVDLLTSFREAKMSNVPHLNAKVLLLPVGKNSRYVLIVAVNLDQNNIKNTVDKFLESDLSYVLNNSYSANLVKIAIPQFTFTTVMANMREVLEDMDVRSLWKDQEATQLISEPAAMPVSYVHRVTMNVNRFGTEREILPVVSLVHHVATDPVLGDTVIVNRPFIFGLIDTLTFSSHLCGVFSKPTYQY